MPVSASVDPFIGRTPSTWFRRRLLEAALPPTVARNRRNRWCNRGLSLGGTASILDTEILRRRALCQAAMFGAFRVF
jgi:hypothetical protein